MSLYLAHAFQVLLPVLHPDAPAVAHRFTQALAEWVHEFDTPTGVHGQPVTAVHQIHKDRLVCPFPREVLAAELVGFDTDHLDALDSAASAARAWGLVTATYRRRTDRRAPDTHPTYTLVMPLEAAVALASARRDVIAHLEAHPITAVHIDGVHPKAKSLTGRGRAGREYERTIEDLNPRTAAEGAAALLRKVELEFVGLLGRVEYPAWLPTRTEAARLLIEAAAAATGAPVRVTPAPTVAWRGSRPVITTELLDLVPALRALPGRFLRAAEGDVPSEGAAPSAPPALAFVKDTPSAPTSAARKSRATSGPMSMASYLATLEAEGA